MVEQDLAATPDKPWYLDLLAWTVAWAFTGYPWAGLAATYLGVSDNRLSVAFVISVVSLSTVVFCSNALRYGAKLPHIGVVVFLLLYTSRLIWDTGRVTEADTEYAFLYYGALVVVPLVALVVPVAPWRISNVVTCCFWVSSIACIAALGLDVLGLSVDPLTNSNRLEFDRLNPITLARTASLSLLSVLIGWSYWDSRQKFVSLFIFPASASVLFLAASRGPMLAFVLTALLFLTLKRQWVLLVTAVAGLVLVLGTSPTINGESIFKLLRVETIERDDSATMRLTYGDIAWQEFLENPLFGSGSELPGIGGYPHNVVLEAGMAMGVPGLLLLLALMALAAWRSVRWLATNTGDGFTASLFLYEVVATQFSGTLAGHTVLLITMSRILSYSLIDRAGLPTSDSQGWSPRVPDAETTGD